MNLISSILNVYNNILYTSAVIEAIFVYKKASFRCLVVEIFTYVNVPQTLKTNLVKK